MTIALVLDCAHPESLSEFWAHALGYKVLGGVENYVMIVDPEEKAPHLLLQKVPEPKSGKNRMHLDIHVADIETEATRLEGLGAKRQSGPQSEHGSTWILMADPEGNEFCVCDGGGGSC